MELDVGLAYSGSDRRVDAARDGTHFLAHFRRVERENLTVFHHHPAMDNRGTHVARAGGIYKGRVDVVEWDKGGGVVIEDDEIGEFAGLKGA